MEPLNNSFLQKLETFMGGLPFKKLPELFDSVFDGLAIVPVWFDSVVEGVDMWFKGEQVDSNRRYLLSFFVFSLVVVSSVHCCLDSVQST
jgi:hypothetical protein